MDTIDTININDNRKSHATRFGTLENRAYFIFNNHLFLKLPDELNNKLALCLNNMALVNDFGDYYDVEPVQVNINIEITGNSI